MKGFHSKVLECQSQFEVVTGEHKVTRVFIPRINTAPSDSGLPSEVYRLQFPVKPAFAITINKSQGQALEMAGLHLPSDCMYVAMSRVGNPSKLKVHYGQSDGHGRGEFTINIVFPKPLTLVCRKVQVITVYSFMDCSQWSHGVHMC